MFDFWVGFLSGFFANWIFSMLGRLLPSTLVRYKVVMGQPRKESDMAGESWLVPIIILPPRWKKAIMNPLIEYLEADVQIQGNNKRIQSKWIVGDVSEIRLRADGAMTIYCYALSRLGHSGDWYIADQAGEEGFKLSTIPSKISLRVTYSVDSKIAANKTFKTVLKNNSIEKMLYDES